MSPRFRLFLPGRAFRRVFAASVVLTATILAPTHAENARKEMPDSEVMHYKDWAVECQRPDSGQRPDTGEPKTCVMFQRQVLKNRQTLLMMTIQKSTADAAPVAVLRAPLGVLLEPGVSISVDEGEPRSFSYKLCNTNGCLVPFSLSQDLQAAFMKGQTLKVTLTTISDSRISVPMSLSGFTAALDSL